MRCFVILFMITFSVVMQSIESKSENLPDKYWQLLDEYGDYIHDSDTLRAKTVLYEMIYRYPYDPVSYVQLSSIFEKQDSLHRAYEVLELGDKEISDEIGLLDRLFEMQVKLNKHNILNRTKEKARVIDLKNIYDALSLSRILYWSEEYQEILTVIDETNFITNINHSGIAYLYGLALYGLNRYEESNDYVNMAINDIVMADELGNLQTYYLQLAINCFHLDEFKQAEESMIKAMDIKIRYVDGSLKEGIIDARKHHDQIFAFDKERTLKDKLSFAMTIDCNNYARLLGEFTDEETNILRIVYRRIFPEQ